MISKSVPWPPVWLALATLEDTTAYSGGYIRLHKWQFDRGPAGTGNSKCHVFPQPSLPTHMLHIIYGLGTDAKP
ncbi:hypothetical protein EDC04DRAFT_296336 [Pisolithus marmoratus]|nr:hypothetical protein EDC04DRAFT_296336 [Pisolithus marmoratus]